MQNKITPPWIRSDNTAQLNQIINASPQMGQGGNQVILKVPSALERGGEHGVNVLGRCPSVIEQVLNFFS